MLPNMYTQAVKHAAIMMSNMYGQVVKHAAIMMSKAAVKHVVQHTGAGC